MELSEFIARVPHFDSLAPREKMRLFAWYLHACRGMEILDNAAIRACFTAINAADPNVARELPRMADRRPPDLIRVRGGYKLEGTLKRSLDTEYALHPKVVLVSQLLSELPNRVPDLKERSFLSEAIDCYRVKAYRATTVMTWNLAFDHLLRWIMSDAARLVDFNAAISKRYPKKAPFQLMKYDDFTELKESEIIEICNTANLVSKNTTEILREKLKRRNLAAHPSDVVVGQAQADDTITDLVNNVVLLLK
jgi:hypothetical protein